MCINLKNSEKTAENKILVIGGAGYIGSHVVKALTENGFKVTVFDNLSSGKKCNLFAQNDFVLGDINDFSALDKEMKNGYSAVVHLAAKKSCRRINGKTGILCSE